MRVHSCIVILAAASLIAACQPASSTEAQASGQEQVVVRSHVKTNEDAQVSGDSAKAVLQRLFAAVIIEDNANAAPSIAAHSIPDTADFSRPFRYDSPTERMEVDKTCAKVRVMLHGLDSTEYLEFAAETQQQDIWHVWKVRFHYEDGQQLSSTFGLIERNGSLLLGDID